MAGEGKVEERRLDAGGYDETLRDIKAGPVALKWSRGGPDRGWVYYAPEVVQVHLAHADNFEGGVRKFGDSAVDEPLDLKRFMRK